MHERGQCNHEVGNNDNNNNLPPPSESYIKHQKRRSHISKFGKSELNNSIS